MPIAKKSVVVKSDRHTKKYKVINMIYEPVTGKWKKIGVVSFGAPGYDDFTMHKDKKRRMAYLKRHGGLYPRVKMYNEEYQPVSSDTQNWGYTGWNTPGFWARWLLWNQPTLTGSARSINHRFGIKVELKI